MSGTRAHERLRGMTRVTNQYTSSLWVLRRYLLRYEGTSVAKLLGIFEIPSNFARYYAIMIQYSTVQYNTEQEGMVVR